MRKLTCVLGMLTLALALAWCGNLPTQAADDPTAPVPTPEKPSSLGAIPPAQETEGQLALPPTDIDAWVNEPGISDKEREARKVLQRVHGKRIIDEQQRLLEANKFFDLGKEQFAAADFQGAELSFIKALEMYPENREAKRLLDLTQQMLGKKTLTPFSQLTELASRSKVAAQADLDQIRLLFEQAQTHFRSGLAIVEFNGRLKELQTAEKLLEEVRWRFNALKPLELSDTYNQTKAEILANIANLLDQVQSQIELTQKEHEQKNRANIAQYQQQLRDEEKTSREETIKKLFRLALIEAYYRNYNKAIMYLNEVVKLDPANRVALEKKAEMENMRRAAIKDKAARDYDTTFKDIVADIERTRVVPTKVIEYPSDWIERTNMRRMKEEAKAEKPDWMKSMEEKMQRSYTFNFEGTPFTDVVRQFQNRTGMTFMVDPQAFEPSGEIPNINLNVNNMKFETILSWVTRMANLKWILRDEAVYFAKEIQGEPVTLVYDVRDMIVPLTHFLAPDLTLSTGEGGGGGGDIGAGQEAPDENSTTIERIQEIIQTLGPEGTWGQNNIQVNAGSLIITQRPEIHQIIRDTLDKIRAAANLVVVVEAKYVDVDDDYLEMVGMQWRDVVYGGTLGKYGSNGIDRWDRYRATGNMNNSINTAVNEYVGGVRLDPAEGFNVAYQLLGNAQATFILSALQKSKKGTLLFAPKVTVFNTQRAYLMVTETHSYVSSIASNNTNGANGELIPNNQPTMGNFMTGVVLDVKPIVSADRRYITLELRPTTATLGPEGIRSINTGQDANNNPITVQDPQLQLRRVRCTVTIPDGGTVLIGGLTHDIDYRYSQGIPILSKIPLIGRLFGSEGKRREKRQTLIFVTARIVIYEEMEKTMGTDYWMGK